VVHQNKRDIHFDAVRGALSLKIEVTGHIIKNSADATGLGTWNISTLDEVWEFDSIHSLTRLWSPAIRVRLDERTYPRNPLLPSMID
jgi:hypothetical protein